MLYALLLTFSRAAWIGLAAGAVVLLPQVRLRIMRLLPLLLIALVVGGAFLWQYRPLLAARTGVATESIELRSVADRVVYTDFALRAIEERLVLGHGAGNFPWRAAAYIEETFFDLKGDHVHHVFLGVWAELGVVGFALFVLALVLGVEAGLRSRAGYILPLQSGTRRGRMYPAPSHNPALAAVVAFAVVGLFDHYPYSQLPFMALWWGLLAASGVPGHGEQQPGERLAERVEAQ
jgi:hypothetical protein